MAYLENPASLADIYNGPVGAFVPGMQAIGRQQERDQITQADQQRRLDYDTQADPYRLRGLDLGNQTTEAQLPGILAQSSMTQRKDKMGAASYEAELKDLLSKHSADQMGNHVKEMQGLGELAITHGAATFAEPFGAAARTKAAFEKAGHGDFWNPEWDTMPVSMLGDKLKQFGTDIHESSAGYQKALDSMNAKNATAKEIAELKAKTELEKTKMLTEMKERLGKLAADAKAAGPVGLEKAGQALISAAQVEPDPEKANLLRAKGQELLDEKARITAAGAAVTQSGAVDLDKLKKEGIVARGPISVPPRAGASAPAGAASAPQKFEEGKVYQDAQGNKAKYVNGKWEPV